MINKPIKSAVFYRFSGFKKWILLALLCPTLVGAIPDDSQFFNTSSYMEKIYFEHYVVESFKSLVKENDHNQNESSILLREFRKTLREFCKSIWDVLVPNESSSNHFLAHKLEADLNQRYNEIKSSHLILYQ
jgi:hypothetical protein